MYIIQKTAEINGKIVTIYYTDINDWSQWTTDETEAKGYNNAQDADIIANMDKPTVKYKL